MKKIAPFNNHSYALKRETCEIITDPDSCNLMEHAQLHPFWMKILESRSWRGTNNNVIRESCLIVTDPDTCNFMEHAQLHPFWRKILESRSWRRANNNVMQNVADKGGGPFESASTKRTKRLFF